MYWERRQRADARGQSSVIGVVLILGLTLTVASGVVVLGNAVLDDSREDSQIGQAEQALTQFDSRAAQVALGESSAQTVRIGHSDGDYHVDPTAGNVTLTHVNHTDVGDNETIYEGDLGALVYTQGDTEVAYQGGGVWRKDDGGTTMVSPPEFHYRHATLTFPIVRVTGEDAASGRISARVTRDAPPRKVFPNDSATYDGFSKDYVNPIENGTMLATIESDYCRGWKNYFESRTEGEVSECQDGKVTAEILSIGTTGEFPIANEPELAVRGVEQLTDLELVFRVYDQGDGQQSDFSNFKWSMADEKGDRQFEVYVHNSGGGPDCDNDETVNATVEMYYSDTGGQEYQTWVNNESHDDFVIECEGDQEVLRVDLLSDSKNMTYMESDEFSQGGGGNSLPQFRGDAENFNDTVVVNDTTYDTGDELPVETLTRHYFAEMGDMDLNIEEQNSAGISGQSEGTIDYQGDGRVITFLHITENEIEIELF